MIYVIAHGTLLSPNVLLFYFLHRKDVFIEPTSHKLFQEKLFSLHPCCIKIYELEHNSVLLVRSSIQECLANRRVINLKSTKD